jgi:NADH dehydrogenase FAD-containing subunit
MTSTHTVVIIGGGFAGLTAAGRLGDAPAMSGKRE